MVISKEQKILEDTIKQIIPFGACIPKAVKRITLKDNRTPFIAKAFAFIIVGYALSPIDLIPDFIPILGYLDDLIILPLLVYLALRFIPEDIMEEYRLKASDMWKDGKPKRWYYALPIVFVWLLIVVVLARKPLLMALMDVSPLTDR